MIIQHLTSMFGHRWGLAVARSSTDQEGRHAEQAELVRVATWVEGAVVHGTRAKPWRKTAG